jgi:tRNA(fMet)-specific endonuclease VapC
MPGEIALDTSIAIQLLNGNSDIVAQVANLPGVILPLIVVGELLFGAENSGRPLKNLNRRSRVDKPDATPQQRQPP